MTPGGGSRKLLDHTPSAPGGAQCGAKFPRKQALAVHLTTHSMERPHPCDQSFKTRNKQRHHTAGYVTPTPYKCAQYGRSFHIQFPGVLRAHVLQAHTGERPFACAQCGKGFVVKSALTLHLKGNHGIGVTERKIGSPGPKGTRFRRELEK
ncbi:Zinc finger protein draculin [Folsomia candida]|uniref:Zinc finger protein draculin n=1 Tax=Folsomia candida TaxID=158441 RepID=A0A226DSH6_FOLCA|nr:Zinc finger protein draculin [Folsomia candida]